MLVWLFACVPDATVVPEGSYIAPADGQTGVSGALPLVIQYGPVSVPAGYEGILDVRVFDLTEGGEHVGRLSNVGYDAGRIEFYPASAWQAGHRYAWTVGAPPEIPHGPEYLIPDNLRGTAAFQAGGVPTLLAATVDADHQACFVWSAPVDADPADLTIEFDGNLIDATAFVQDDGAGWSDPYALANGDVGLSLVCADTTAPLVAGAPVRVTWAGGVWTAILDALPPADLVSAFRHADLPVAAPQ